MTTREIRAGSLTVTAQFDGEVLHRIDLPPLPPADLSAEMLAALLSKLAASPTHLGEHPRFHRAVWEQMKAIPFGQTRTYGELARAAGSPKGFRAVGQACGANPLPLLIPCHRVVSSSGLGGFSAGLAWKKKLLALEGVSLRPGEFAFDDADR